MPPSRDQLSTSIGRLLFLRLSKEDAQKLFKPVGDKPDWATIAHFTRQALKSPEAAATLGTLFVEELKVLNVALEPQMYLVGSTLTVADIACYVALIGIMQAFTDAHRFALCNVSRWFDFMQHTVERLSPPAELGCGAKVQFSLDMPESGPPPIASLPPLCGGASSSSAAVDVSDGGAAAAPAAAKEEKADKKAEKKEKKEKKEKAPPPPPASDGQSDLSKLDIRVGLILSAEKHPDADALYVEKVDVGEAEPRTVVSGLVKYMEASALQNRRAVLLCNLKPAKMKGIESQAMVLAASNADHTIVELLSPPDGVPVGERVTFEGHPGEPLPPNQVAKKKIWEAVQPDLGTSDACVAMWKDLPFSTTKGPCTVATIKSGGIK